MRPFPRFPLDFNRIELIIFFVVGSVVLVLFIWKKWQLRRMSLWPVTSAKIENVFAVVYDRRNQATDSVLAYSYTIDDGYYSGEIRLLASGDRMEDIGKALVGHQVLVHHDPGRPEKSIYLEDAVEDWDVDADARISLLSWLDFAN